jgi:hypothetical protein
MSDINPYASPQNSSDDILPVVAVEAVQERPLLFRKGNQLVMYKRASLPDRCIKSNQPANGRRLRRNLTWHHPAIYLTIFIGLLVYIILMLILQKKATIYIGLSEPWIRKRRWTIFWGWMISLSGLALLIASAVAVGDPRHQMDWAAWGIPLGILMFFFGAIYGIIGSRMVTPVRIDDNFVWLKGVHPDFLAELPEWPYNP